VACVGPALVRDPLPDEATTLDARATERAQVPPAWPASFDRAGEGAPDSPRATAVTVDADLATSAAVMVRDDIAVVS